MMNVEQELLLSAYFDNQVDPDEKRRAEELLAADPAAAEVLYALSAVRELVAALPRPPAPDVSAAVVGRLAAVAARPRPWRSWGPQVVRGLCGSGIAASVALLVYVGGQARSRDLAGQATAVPPRSIRVASSPTTSVAGPSPTVVEPFPSQADAFAAGAETAPKLVGREPSRPVDPPGYLEIWAAAGPRREFTVAADPGEATAETVATLLGQSTHRDFYRIELPSPSGRAPGDSTGLAFAATLDPNEFVTLRRRLASHFGARVEEAAADPEIAAMLAAVGRATSAPASPAADVLTPKPEELALRVHPAAVSPRPEEPKEPPKNSVDAAKPAAVPAPSRPAVVLIWVVGPSPK